jgi:hypothetical protein
MVGNAPALPTILPMGRVGWALPTIQISEWPHTIRGTDGFECYDGGWQRGWASNRDRLPVQRAHDGTLMHLDQPATTEKLHQYKIKRSKRLTIHPGFNK